MMVSFRDSSVVIIECGRTLIRAGIGLQDLLKAPSVVGIVHLLHLSPICDRNLQEIQARVGLRRNPGDTANGISSLRPFEGSENLRPSASSSRASSLPCHPNPSAKVHDYLIGPQLDEALEAGQDIIVSWPFADGDIRDWTQAEALWYVYSSNVKFSPRSHCIALPRKYVLFNALQLKRTQNESPVMLSMPAGLFRESSQRICQIFFERFNVAGFGLLDRPIAQLYAAGQLNGIVIDIGHEITDITPMYDGFIINHARTSTPLGIRDCQVYLANILRSNQSVMAAASPPDNPSDPVSTQKFIEDLVKHIWAEGLVRVPSDGQTVEIPEDEGVTDIAAVLVAGKEKAVIESGMKKKLTAKASAAEQARAREIEALDLVTVQFRDHSITLGKERHRFCEPLYDPTLLNGLSVERAEPYEGRILPLQEAAGFAVRQIDVVQRQYIWQGLFVTGDLTNHVKGASPCTPGELKVNVAKVSEMPCSRD